jgi:membrane dipeptidase
MPPNRREMIRMGSGAAALALLAPHLLAADPAAALYARSIAIDGLGFPGSEESEEGAALTAGEIRHLRDSGMTAVHLTVGAVGTMPALQAFENIVRNIAHWEDEVSAHPEVLASIRTVGDIEAAKASGRTGLIYGLQDGVSFEDDPDRLSALHHFGIRVIQPTYNRRNLLGDGCMEPADAGLSRNGLEAVERMNSLGIMLDLSHCGRRTAADAMAASKRPASFTHTGCYAIAQHPRHRTDEEIRAAADSGGVIGIFIMPYLAGGHQPTAADVLRHIDHVIEIAGEDHVSIGTDGTVSPTELTEKFIEVFSKNVRERKQLGIAAPGENETGYLFASDLNTPRRFETLAGMMLERGYSEARVQKILGGNLMRVFADSWGATQSA